MLKPWLERIKKIIAGRPDLPTRERRKLIRLPCRIAVECSSPKGEFKAWATDIGLNGMRLESQVRLEAGAPMNIICKGQPGGSVRCEVVWCHPRKHDDGYYTGVKFSDTNENMRKSWVKPALKALGFSSKRIKERRREVRIPARSQPRVSIANRAGDVLTDGVLLNLSVGGALVKIGVQIPVRLKVVLQVDPIGVVPPLEVLSEVRSCKKDVHSQKWIHGLQFIDSPESLVTKYMEELYKDI